MATPWVFTLSPETINEIQVTGTSSTVILQRTVISGSDTGFYTEAFDTNESVTISAVGYANLNVIVDIATTGLVMNPLPKPDYLYAYTDLNASPSIVYTDTTNISVGQILYDNTGTDTGLIIDTINQDGSFMTNLSIYYSGGSN